MLLTIPKALVVGFYSGVEDSGLIPGIKTALAQSGMRQVMWDNLTELFEDRYGFILLTYKQPCSDAEDEDDQPGVTGMPLSRDDSYLNDSEDETPVEKSVNAGLIDSTHALEPQLNRNVLDTPTLAVRWGI